MAGNGDASLRSQLSTTRSGGSRRTPELMLLDIPLPSRKSGQSMTRSSLTDEKRWGPTHQSGPSWPSSEKHEILQEPLLNTGCLPVRTVPAWVQSASQANKLGISPQSAPILPGGARVADHHFSISENARYEGYGISNDGRLQSRWKPFVQSTLHTQTTAMSGEKVDDNWLDTHFGDYSRPWQGKTDETDLESGFGNMSLTQRRKKFTKRFQRTILQSPMVPLIIRLTVFIYSVAALGLGGSIRHYATKYDHPQGPSAEMAIIVDAVALVYLVYITYDEYTGKPLGLRAPKTKMRLLFLDLVFIVFGSANLSLAFESLSDVTSSCTSAKVNDRFDPKNDTICERQKALASVLLLALLAWLMTFSISVLRVVERVAAK
ncbi:hypothetical protein LOZ57_002665 [Ophidiomyces ophidiicola]|uniref:uncharacterized protein n=1 Tax=Ophidiomyces ophidiicola TaxID=1387563 RepID=UPI0020C1C5D4|nr:uncharacterized protein LOZ57_002665 [Ophidiomyces ophidiicola]KAI1949291.1 hypothetical protein LOZ57_002665 [Ophidiomyces ophidiicola]KAI2043218.1 hypothetical protein LOZ43_006654 [Ophidiomyces ophidiicola]